MGTSTTSSTATYLFVLLNKIISSWSVAVAAGTFWVAIIVYRLHFHPLARFPGPKIAAITRYYEAYYDVVLNGQYTFKIAKLHEQYGPIIRISPHELHVADPSFFAQLYRQEGRWDKYAWAYDAHSAPGSTIFTTDHYLHRARRAPLNAFFSKARVASRQGLIRRHVETLCRRVRAEFADRPQDQDRFMDLGLALSEFSRTAAAEFTLGEAYGGMEQKDLSAAGPAADGYGDEDGGGRRPGGGVHKRPSPPVSIWHVTKHFPWYGPSILRFPSLWALAARRRESPSSGGSGGGGGLNLFLLHLKRSTESTARLFAEEAGRGGGGGGDQTGEKEEEKEEGRKNNIVREILGSNLPAPEKAFHRVFLDVATITGAGIETTASVLRLVLYHVYTAEGGQVLAALRAELDSSSSSSSSTISPQQDEDDEEEEEVEEEEEPPPSLLPVPRLKTLENLPYLTAVLLEGLRLSPGVATRGARIAPDRDLVYYDDGGGGGGRGAAPQQWRIPAGYPVGMTTLLMHLDPKLYPEPRRFYPGRWLLPPSGGKNDHHPEDEEEALRRKKKKNPRAAAADGRTYAPFSRGTRICLGMHFAWAEMYLLLAALVLNFDFEFVDPGLRSEDFECVGDQFTIRTSRRAGPTSLNVRVVGRVGRDNTEEGGNR